MPVQDVAIDDNLPFAVENREPVWIPMADGTRLAARIWLPEDAEANPVPVIVEAIPYRWRDFYRHFDAEIHPWYAGHGYACVRIDLRGSGNSEGVLVDEYAPQELEDIVTAIAWIAEQPWSTGKVGMMGISWGGFNSLQVAALRPPALKTIITSCSTDDRYADDVHFMGGCLLNDNFSWGANMIAKQSLPPDPQIVGEAWRDMWLKRLQNLPNFVANWMAHQRRDGQWKHGSVCEDYADIEIPVFAIGGWADAYSNAIPRLLANLSVPRIGVIGPWGHCFGYEAYADMPRPGIGFLQESKRWWDHWLKGEENGIMAEPMLRAWQLDHVPPAAGQAWWPGRWIAEPTWPMTDAPDPLVLHLDGDGRLAAQGSAFDLALRSPEIAGAAGGEWCPHAETHDLAGCQRRDDGLSLCFDSAPLDEPVDLLGAPEIELDLAVDRPFAKIAVRLNDIAPDGSSLRVTWALANLAHDADHETVAPLDPARRVRRVRRVIRLNDIAYRVPAGHRLRIAVSTAYWPIMWPAPEPVTLTVHGGTLTMPRRRERPEDDAVAFEPPAMAQPIESTVLEPGRSTRTIAEDVGGNRSETTIVADGGRSRIEEIDLVITAGKEESYAVEADDPLTAKAHCRQWFGFERADWRAATELTLTLTCDSDTFHVTGAMVAREGDKEIWRGSLDRDIPRDGQ